MRTKNKIKSFYRHNKKCIGMWNCLVLLFLAALPPYPIEGTFMVMLLCCMWLLVWMKERHIDTLERGIEIERHLAHRALDRMCNEYKKLFRETFITEKILTPENIQHRIDHYTAVAEAEMQAFDEGLKDNTGQLLFFFYDGKADAYKNILKELYPDIGSDRVYPLDLAEFGKQVEQIKSMYK